MDPDESTIHSSYKSCSEKCSRGANQAYPTSLSRFAARNSLVTPETPPDRTPVPTRKRASAPGALNLAMRRHPVLSGRPGRFYPIGASRFALTACVAREGCSTLDHYGRGFVLIRLGTNAPDVSALKSEAANGPVGSLRAALLDKICDQIVWLRPAPVRSARLASRAFGALRAQHIGNTLDGNTWLADEYSEVAFLLQSAQQSTFRNANGQITGTVSTDSNGQRTFRGGSGRIRCPRLSKVQSVDRRMRLECGVGFRQLRTCRRIRPGQLCANTGREQMQQVAPLFDHHVGAREQRGRHGEAEHPGCLGIDDQLELRRLHHRQVRGLRTLEDATGIDADLTPRFRNVGSVAHQAAGFGIVTPRICGGDRMARC